MPGAALRKAQKPRQPEPRILLRPQKLPEHPLDASRMTETQLHAELEKGYADMQAGRTIPASKAFADIRKEYGI